MTHTLKHYKLNKDGSLRLVRTELVEDPPRTKLDFSSLAYRDRLDAMKAETSEARFEALADAVCEAE